MPTTGGIALTVVAVLTFAPWAVFLAGICKLTDVFNDSQGAKWARQQQFMLEWFEIWFQFAIIIIVIVVGLARMAKYSGYLLVWIATNTALMIYSATLRLITIQQVEDGYNIGVYSSSNLSGLRCTAAGQISTAFMNFMIPIALSFAAVHEMTTAVAHTEKTEEAAAV